MPSQLRSEQIYDAILDEEGFSELPVQMARAYGARSCVLHWRYTDGAAEVMAHSRYYTDDQLTTYANNFTGADLWAVEALKAERVNRVWDCDGLVSEKEYERGEFYNEWIRQMGDDTFHCIGTVQKTHSGVGIIGLHRGRGQGSFAQENVQALSEDLLHLRRMLAIRGRMSELARRTKLAEEILDIASDAFLSVTADGKLTLCNSAADALIRQGDCLRVRQGKLLGCTAAGERALAAAIARAANPFRSEASVVRIERSGGGHYHFSVVAMKAGEHGRQVFITARGPQPTGNRLWHQLQSLYGLTQAEAEVAVQLAEGAGPAEKASSRQVSVGTVRSQLKSIYGKLGCRRQAGVVAAVKSLPSMNC